MKALKYPDAYQYVRAAVFGVNQGVFSLPLNALG